MALPSPFGHTNALARESSPYLLQHAHNPVDWHAWGPEAFELARQRDVPIFLSIGYSTCYWCHVMERQCFENEDIAALMNELFVNIKVDREERPDVDDIYMTATQLMTRRGGWPMSVFLTPLGEARAASGGGLKPFWCGTYIPPEPAHGMPSFPQVLRGISEAWRQRRADVVEQADRVAEAVAQTLGHRDVSGVLLLDLVSGTANQLLRSYDPDHGGFGAPGSGPKFPQPSNLLFLMAVHCNNPEAGVWPAVAHTLDRMARGGMYDQIGGGFHRYSTDEKWLVPHFEKMLYDNGQLLEAYATAYTIKSPAFYVDVARQTAEYVLREMRDEQGGFYSAQDAEVDAREGGNYVWTAEEVREAIVDEALAKLALAYYGLDGGPNFQDPHHPDATPVNVLYMPAPPQEWADQWGLSMEALNDRVQQVNVLLKSVRDRRKQPGTDDKVIVSWNGLMIAGLAKAGRVFEAPRFVEASASAAQFILAQMRRPDGLLHRTWRKDQAKHAAVFEDYAMLAHGLIELHRATDEPRWLDAAKQMVKIAIEQFASASGGYFDTLADQSDLFVRSRSLHDGALPSGNAVMTHNLIDLFEITGERSFFDRAVSDLRGLGGALQQMGLGMVHMQHALLRAMQHDASILEAAPQGRDASGIVTAAVDLPDVTLTIALGYHVLAEQLELQGENCEINVVYPAPIEKRYAYTDEPVRVYEGVMAMRVVILAAASDHPKLVLHYQACTDTECLQPATLDLPVTITP